MKKENLEKLKNLASALRTLAIIYLVALGIGYVSLVYLANLKYIIKDYDITKLNNINLIASSVIGSLLTILGIANLKFFNKWCISN